MTLYEGQGRTFGEAVRFATLVEGYRRELATLGMSEAEIDDIQRIAYRLTQESGWAMQPETVYRIVFEGQRRAAAAGRYRIPRLTDRAWREAYRKTTLYQARYVRRVCLALVRDIWLPIRAHLREFLRFWHGR